MRPLTLDESEARTTTPRSTWPTALASRILLVEDSAPLAHWLTRALTGEGHRVDCVDDGLAADRTLTSRLHDLVILDIALPGIDGREVLRRLRQRHDPVPVLILTAYDSTEGLVHGLDLGADDYLGKPFRLAELEARVRALLRRAGAHGGAGLRCGPLVLDEDTRLFLLANRVLPLPPREHAVLEALIERTGKTVSKRSLARRLCPFDEEVSAEAIEIYVHRIRRKLEGHDVCIITLRGLGYLLERREAS